MMSASNAFSANIEANNGTVTVVLIGELDMDTARELNCVLDGLIEQGPDEVILDFSGLSFIDSSGIAALISAQKQLNAQGRKLGVRSPSPLVVKVFEVTDLMSFLNVQSNQAVE